MANRSTSKSADLDRVLTVAALDSTPIEVVQVVVEVVLMDDLVIKVEEGSRKMADVGTSDPVVDEVAPCHLVDVDRIRTAREAHDV